MNAIVTLTPNPALDRYVEIPKLVPDVKLRTTAPRTDPGGGGINVSRLLTRLGVPGLAVLAAGGFSGRALLDALQAEGIETASIAIGGETRISFTARAADTDHLYRFVAPGPRLTEAEGEALLERLGSSIHEGDIVVCSGSLPPGLPTGFWASCAERVRARRATMILDSSVGQREALQAGVAILRLNREEQAALAGTASSWPRGIGRWADETRARYGAKAVVVTHGAEGAVMATPAGVLRATPPAVKIESAIGAGDSFVAGMSFALLKGLPEPEVLRWGVAAAAATMQTPGTLLSTRQQIEAVRRRME